MLSAFRVANYRALRNEQRVSIRPAAESAAHSEAAYDRGPGPVLALAAATGADQATVLAALRTMRAAVLQLADDAAHPHAFYDPSPIGYQHPSLFEVELLLGPVDAPVRYTYGFTLLPGRIEQEWLYSSATEGEHMCFTRRSDPHGHVTVAGAHADSGDETAASATTLDPGALFLTTGALHGDPRFQTVFQWFTDNLGMVSSATQQSLADVVAERMLTGPQAGRDCRRLEALLVAADLGITGITVTDSAAGGHLQLLHRSAQAPVAMELSQQSRGTRAVLAVIAAVLHSLAHGSVLLLETTAMPLHPRLLAEILRLFQNSDSNDQHAQAVLATHATGVLLELPARPLEPEQIWHVTTDTHGASALVPTAHGPNRH